MAKSKGDRDGAARELARRQREEQKRRKAAKSKQGARQP